MQLNEVQRRHLAITRFFFYGFSQDMCSWWWSPCSRPAFHPHSHCRPKWSAQAGEDGHIGTSLLELWHSREKDASMDL